MEPQRLTWSDDKLSLQVAIQTAQRGPYYDRNFSTVFQGTLGVLWFTAVLRNDDSLLPVVCIVGPVINAFQLHGA